MQPILVDIVRQTSNLFDVVKIVGTEAETKIEAQDKEMNLFLKATVKEPVGEFVGEFGLSNLGLLSGLLNFSSYQTPEAKFKVKRENKKDYGETVTEFQFRDANNAGSNFKTTSAKLVPEQAKIGNIPWDIEIQPNKAKIAEFAQLSSLYRDVEFFGVHTLNGNLIFSLGDETSTTNNANMVFANDVTGEIQNGMLHNISYFLSILKIAGSNPVKVSISNRTVLGITIDTDIASYFYCLRAKR